jgi:mannose-6-phosphate isomerase-like protein (cupin superfamily)
MSIWVVHLDRQKTNALDDKFDIHDGVEEAIYGLKGRVKVFTPNESCILKPGGFVWIPASMPHAARAMQDRAVFIAIYAPARGGRDRNRLVSAQESKRIARQIVRKTASWRRTRHE